MDTKRTAVLGMSGVLTLGLALSGCGAKVAQSTSPTGSNGSASSPDTLTVGASMSLTGQLAREGVLTKEGYSACQDVVNAKGGIPVAGKKVKLNISYQDDTSQPDTAAQLVDQFNDKGVKVILSSYGSASTQAQAAVVERNKQLMLDSAGADNKIFSKGYKQTFAVLSPATEYASSIVKAIGELAQPKPTTIAFLSADDGFSKTVTTGAVAEAKKEGFKVIAPEFFPSGATDVSSALTKIKGQHPDVIIGSVHLVEGIAIVKQAKELGVTPSGGIGETVAPPTPDFAKTLGPLAENVLGSSQWTPQVKGKDEFFGTAKDYATLIQSKFGHAPDYHDAEASAACLALVLAAQKAGTTDVGALRDAVSALDTQSFFGRIKFDSTGQNTFKPMSVIQIQQGKSVDVWPSADAAAKLVWPGSGK